MATQKVPLTITYRHAGTQPPIFLAGEFSDPPWEPQEMDYTTAEDGEHTFKKEVFAEPGSKVQYKFRVGLGDWWVLNDDAPTAMDDGGFLNNLAEVPALAEPSTPAAVAEKARQIASGDAGNADAQKNGDSKSTEAVKSRDQEEPTIANAAKELRHRPDLHSGTGTSTPEFARTAAEVADSAALLDKEDEEPYVANAAKELMHRLDPRSGSGAGSGASTPSFVRTAAEVADSAALLDKEDSEPEVTDEEAGKTGFRRLSSTPIQDVAAVAAEVADTAKDLDRESFPQLEVRPAEYDDIDPYEFDEPVVSENKAPLFAHECVGMELYEGDDAPGPLDDEHHNNEYEEDRRPSTVYDDDEEIDLNDPTLERFPSNREEIIDTVRKLEGGLNEDHADVEGLVPLSPVVGPSGPQNHDLVGDFLVSSPAVSSPIVTRGSGSGSRLLSLPRASFGSINSDRASALSLDSISEEEARDEAELDQLPVLSTPKPRKHPSADDTKSPTSDDDEGIVMKSGSGQNGNSSEVSPSEVTPVRTPGGDSTPKTPPAESRTEDHHDSSDGQPEIKLVPASEATETQTPEMAPQTNGERGSSSPRIVIQNEETGEGTENHAEESADTSAPSTADTTKSTGADNGAQSQLRRRVVPPDRVATPSSINDAHIQAAKSGNWFRSFFKVLFVDWIGGFINKLFGRKRETLLAAGAAGILIGVAWWRNTSK